jgi:hypothetical protein
MQKKPAAMRAFSFAASLTVLASACTPLKPWTLRKARTPPAQHEQQFLRLRDRIEERAARKFSDVELEGNPPA